MMALSGVIRTGHIELRYETPLTSFPASWQSGTTKTPLGTEPASRRAPYEMKASSKQAWQWIRFTLKTVMQPSRKPISPHWNFE
jgi:hypothetical protein